MSRGICNVVNKRVDLTFEGVPFVGPDRISDKIKVLSLTVNCPLIINKYLIYLLIFFVKHFIFRHIFISNNTNKDYNVLYDNFSDS